MLWVTPPSPPLSPPPSLPLQYVVYPLGHNVVVKNISANCQAFLQGHNGDVTCLAVSHDGTMLATGQQSEEGARADVLVWDLEVMFCVPSRRRRRRRRRGRRRVCPWCW